jgi:hypothetical protein
MLDESTDTWTRSGDEPAVKLAVFGKHPAWNDHMEPLGLRTRSLQSFHEFLYLNGVRSQLDSGAWDALDEEVRVPAWNHEMLMIGKSGMILATLWASSDGKGRSAYPMVAALHVPTSSLPNTLEPLYRVLAAVRADCVAATTREGVRGGVEEARRGVDAAMGELLPRPPGEPNRETRLAFLDDRAMGTEREGFFRLLHALRSELGPFAPESKGKRVPSALFRSYRLRFDLEEPYGSRSMWRLFFEPHLRKSIVWQITNPLDEPWCDITVGNLDPEQVYRMRVRPAGIPPVTEIAYNIAPETLEHARKVLEAFADPGAIIPSITNAARPAKTGDGLLGSLVNRFFRERKK